MPDKITSLPRITLDFTDRGPGLLSGLRQATNVIEADRKGHLVLDVKVTGSIVPVVIDRTSLYVLGFQSDAGWHRFSDATWSFVEPATDLKHDGTYAALGGLDGTLTRGSIDGIGKLSKAQNAHVWKPALLALVVVVAENLRLVPVQMRVLGLLNGFQPSISLVELGYYILSWGQASKGRDMSREAGEGMRVGFRDPTLIRR